MSIQKKDFTFLVVVVIVATVLAGCAASKVSSKKSVAWSYPIEWSPHTTVEKTPSGQFVIQEGDSLIVIDGSTGKVLLSDLPDKKGNVFKRFASEVSEGVKKTVTFSQDNPTIRTYVPMELPSLNTLLLFNIREDSGYVRNIDLTTGSERWETTDYVWNREGPKDEAHFIADVFTSPMSASHLAVDLALESRNVYSVIKELPNKDAFLFKTTNDLYLVDVKSGEPIWTNKDMKSTGIAAYEYLPETDQILLVGDIAGVRDAVTAAKQMMLIDAATGQTVWETRYKMRSPMVKRVSKHHDSIYLYSYMGSAEVFHFKDGTRLMGTRDYAGVENTEKLKSFLTNDDAALSGNMSVADPQFETHYAYAVNPIKYYAVGVPDWEVAKINTQTNQAIWTQKLIHAPNIKAIYLTDSHVVLSIPASSILGKVKEAGLYAFSKETGKLDWELTEPFKKKRSKAYFSVNTALVNNGEKTFVVDLSDGKVLKTSSFGVASNEYYPVSENTLASYNAEPFVVTMTKPDFSILSTDTLHTKKGGDLTAWNNSHLIFKRVPLFGDIEITAYNHTTRRKAGDFSTKKENPTPYANDLYLIDDKIVLLRKGALVAYKLD